MKRSQPLKRRTALKRTAMKRSGLCGEKKADCTCLPF